MLRKSGQSSRSLPQARRIVGSGDENGHTGHSQNSRMLITFFHSERYNNTAYQETRSVQLPYFRATAFPQVGLLLDTPLPLKLLSPEACFVFFAEFDSIPHCVIFAFPRLRKTCGALRIAGFILSYYFPHKNWNYCLKYCQSFVKRVSFDSVLLISYWRIRFWFAIEN